MAHIEAAQGCTEFLAQPRNALEENDRHAEHDRHQQGDVGNALPAGVSASNMTS